MLIKMFDYNGNDMTLSKFFTPYVSSDNPNYNDALDKSMLFDINKNKTLVFRNLCEDGFPFLYYLDGSYGGEAAVTQEDRIKYTEKYGEMQAPYRYCIDHGFVAMLQSSYALPHKISPEILWVLK